MHEQPEGSRSGTAGASEPATAREDAASGAAAAMDAPPRAPAPRLAALVWISAALGAAGGAVVGLFDFAITSLRASGMQSADLVLLALGTTTTLITAGAIVGGLFGTLLAATLRWATVPASPRLTGWLQATLAGAPLAALMVWVMLKWVIPHWSELSARTSLTAVATTSAAALTCIGAARLALALLRRYDGQRLPAGHWLAVALLLGGLAAAQGIDHFVLVGLYDYVHAGLGAVAWVAASLLSALLWRTLEAAGRSRQALRALTAVGALGAATAVALEAGQYESPYVQHTTVTDQVRTVARQAFDWDDDGFSPILGGGDCNDWNGAVSPGALEVPENGIDDNCAAGDASWPRAVPTPCVPEVNRDRYNVALVVLESVRADHIGTYGYARPTTPHLDRLARESLVFRRAYSQATKTFYSIPSLLLGRYPSNIPRDFRHRRVRRARKAYMYHIPPILPSLPELLHDAGYHNVGLSYTPMPFTQGLDRGFRVHKAGRRLTRKALRQLKRRRDKPFFLFLFYGYTHSPYTRYKRYDFGTRAIDRYDSSIARSDAELGRLIRWLKRANLYEKTVVIVTADHGEEFGEHGGYYHGPRLYDELIHVPLVLHIPGGPTGEVDSTVELTDVMPTVLYLLNLTRRAECLDGQNLLAALARPVSRPAYSELGLSGPLSRAWTTDRYKLIVHSAKARVELYDLQQDPAESRNLVRQLPEVAAQLRENADLRAIASQAGLMAAARRGKLPAKSLCYLRRNGVVLQALQQLRPPVSKALRRALREVARREDLSPEVSQKLRQLGVEPEQRTSAERKRRRRHRGRRARKPRVAAGAG